MKKLLLSTLLAMGAMAPMAAQELAIQFEGENVENGGTVIYREYTAETFESIPGYTIWTVDPELYLVAGKQEPITIHAYSDISFQLCAGGDCVRKSDITKSVENFVAGVPLNLLLDWQTETYEGNEIEIPDMTIHIEVWYDDDPENVYRITLMMGGITAAGVESIGASQNSVVFNGNSLNYDVNGISQLSLYSLSGKTVMNKTVSGNGAVSLDGLTKGVYLYRLTGKNGKAVKAAKIIIK